MWWRRRTAWGMAYLGAQGIPQQMLTEPLQVVKGGGRVLASGSKSGFHHGQVLKGSCCSFGFPVLPHGCFSCLHSELPEASLIKKALAFWSWGNLCRQIPVSSAATRHGPAPALVVMGLRSCLLPGNLRGEQAWSARDPKGRLPQML